MLTPLSASRGSTSIGGLVLLAALGIAFWSYFGDQAKAQLGNLFGSDDPLVSEALQRYKEAQQENSPLVVCVRASLVKAAYQKAGDLEQSRKWAAVETDDCAGVTTAR